MERRSCYRKILGCVDGRIPSGNPIKNMLTVVKKVVKNVNGKKIHKNFGVPKT